MFFSTVVLFINPDMVQLFYILPFVGRILFPTGKCFSSINPSLFQDMEKVGEVMRKRR